MRRVPASRRIAAGPNVWVMSASCPSGMRVPSWPSIRSVRIASKRVAPVVAKPHDQVEAPLPDPDLRVLLADEADPDRSNHVARRQADARRRLAIDGDLQLRQAGELLRAQVGDARRRP